MHFSFLQKLGAALLIAVWLIWGSNMAGNLLLPMPEPPTEGVAKTEKAVTAAAPAAPTPAPPAPNSAPKGETDAVTLLASASPEAGEKVFKKCRSCHNAEKGAKAKVGPNLWDVIGRPKGSAAGFTYSSALAGLGGEWTYADLDAFLASPKSFAPGNKMPFAGLKKAGDRAAVIAFLRSLSDSPKPLP